jgi:hypothetical protein
MVLPMKLALLAICVAGLILVVGMSGLQFGETPSPVDIVPASSAESLKT